MKKEILLIREKRERITIRHKHRGEKAIFICSNCGQKCECLLHRKTFNGNKAKTKDKI